MSVFANVAGAAKKHPYWLVGGVLAVIVIFQLRGNSSSTATGNTGVTTLEEDPNQIAANVALQQSANELNAQTIQANDAVQMYATQSAAQTTQTQIMADLYDNYFNTAASVQNTSVAAAQEVTDRQTDAELKVAQGSNDLAVATLAANTQNQQQQNAYSYAEDILGTAQNVSDRYDPAYATSAFQNVISSATGAPEELFSEPSSDGALHYYNDTPLTGSQNNLLSVILNTQKAA